MKWIVITVVAIVVAGAFVFLGKNDDTNGVQTQSTQINQSGSAKGAKSISDCNAISDGTAKLACLKSLKQ